MRAFRQFLSDGNSYQFVCLVTISSHLDKKKEAEGGEEKKITCATGQDDKARAGRDDKARVPDWENECMGRGKQRENVEKRERKRKERSGPQRGRNIQLSP